jgi:glycosyltransferase involved in cell wall biosynthesis
MQHPLRSAVEDHLYSFRRYSNARTFYVNAMLGPVPGWIRRIEHDAIVFHTSLLSSMRWNPRLAGVLRERAIALRDLPGVRAAMPQDEFLRSDELCAFIREAGVDVVFSVAPEPEWPAIYPGVEARIEPALTGYLDERTLGRIDAILQSSPHRPVDVSYRAGAARPYLGRHGMLKTDIAPAGAAEAAARGLTADISISPDATLTGDDWFRHLARSRWTLGVEGGASILDRDGSVRAATERYMAEHPDASYDEVEAACFAGRDGELELFAISPRHLEACATRTGQILVEGSYSGVLEPGRHYLPVKADLSDLGEVLEQAKDEDLRRRITDAAYDEIVAPGRYTYGGLVEHVETALQRTRETAAPRRQTAPSRRAGGGASLAVAEVTARVRDDLSWRRVAVQVAWRRLLHRLVRRVRPARPPATTVVSVTPGRLDADSRTLKEAVSLGRAGLRSIVVERLGSTEAWDDVPIEVVSLAPPAPVGAGVPQGARTALRPLAAVLTPFVTLAATNRATARALPSADLYWVHGVAQLPAVALRAKRQGVPFVYDAHDYYVDSANDPDLPLPERWRRWVYGLVERAFVPLAAARVTVGAGVRELQEGRFHRPFSVFHNAHDPRLDRPTQANVRERLGLAANDFLLVAAGNSKTGTAFEPVFDALAAVGDGVHLVFVGRNYDGAQQLARDRGLDGRVHFLEPVPPAEVTSFIGGGDAAAILYYPITSNFLNALPNRLYQAISAGLPLLYPETMTAIRALCEEHEVGLPVDTRDARSLEAGIRRLVEDRRELERLRGNARRAAEQVSWEREEERLLPLVAGLVRA